MYKLVSGNLTESYSTKADLIIAIGELASQFGCFTQLYLDNKLVYLNLAIVEWAEMERVFLNMENWINSQDFTKATIN